MAVSYKFGQFRASQGGSYINALTYALENKRVESSLSKGIVFLDKAIELSGNNQLQGRISTGKIKSYYLRFKIYKQECAQVLDIILRNTTLAADNTQTLGTIQVPAGAPDDYSTFEFVITPNENRVFNQIHFELARTIEDYDKLNADGTYGRQIKLVIERLAKIQNLIDTLNPSIDNKGALKQIGVQSVPGLIMCINGEQIKVGRSGIYEIKNGIQVTFIGFIVENGDKYFILDYQY